MIALTTKSIPPTPLPEAPRLVDDLKVLIARLGITNASFYLAASPGIGQSRVAWTTYPREFIDLYRRRDYLRIDPVIGMVAWGYLPVDWRDLDRRSAEVVRLFEDARAFGIGPHGLTIPVRDVQGTCGLFTVSSDLPEAAWLERRHQFIRELQATACKLHAHALTVFGRAPATRLTPRELEALQWAAQGKTTAETAIVLGVSERTVRAFLDGARHKLGAGNVTHAVARALSLRLLPPNR